jgi:hypothetical protein
MERKQFTGGRVGVERRRVSCYVFLNEWKGRCVKCQLSGSFNHVLVHSEVLHKIHVYVKCVACDSVVYGKMDKL